MSEWSKEGNLIDSTEPSAQVVEEPRLNVPPSLSTALSVESEKGEEGARKRAGSQV